MNIKILHIDAPRNTPSDAPPDYIVNGKRFTQLSRRAQAKVLFSLLRLRREIDPSNGCHIQDADFLDTEVDRLSHLFRSRNEIREAAR